MGSLYGGISAYNESGRQATLELQEAERQARLIAEEDTNYRSKMEMGFLKSGVSLEGTPLIVLEESVKRTRDDINAVRTSGRQRASSLKRQGRDALIGGVIGGATDVGRLAAGGF